MQTKLNSSMQAKSQPLSKIGHLTTIAAALGVLLSLTHVDAYALSLGRITALSSLGEPFSASIEVPDINPEEISSLKTTLASPDAFKAAGMEYNQALTATQITLTKRDNGTSYLLLRSDKIVADPFINLLIDTKWATGHIVRNYTLLLDPPTAKQSEVSATTAPLLVLQPTPTSTPPSVPPTTTEPARAPVLVQRPSSSVAMPQSITIAKSTQASSPQSNTNSGNQIKVNAGDTAGKIAANNLPTNISLEQMLAAMLRGNPQAFIGNNINRLKAGIVLDLPTESEAGAVSTSEAKQSLSAQSKDFTNFRKKLAENAPSLASQANRVASGKIDAKVNDQKATPITPDKLTLSKGGLSTDSKSKGNTNEKLEKIAQTKQANDDASRSAELAKNISDLNKIAGSASVAATTSANVGKTPEAAAATGATTASIAPVPTTPLATPKTEQPTKPITVTSEASALDFLMDDPLVLPTAGGLLAVLLAGGLYANSRRKKKLLEEEAAEDALIDEVTPHEESFFSDTSNEPILDKESNPETAKLPEQISAESVASNIQMPEINGSGLDTRAVVDPLTEASVYLDYGRDMQAEEILKDGLKSQPQNIAIYTKLMDIYAQRRDAKSFENMALKAKILLSEDSPQWQAISKQGFDLEPQNLLYRLAAPVQEDPLTNLTSQEFSTRTLAQIDPESAKAPASVDLDLDFNFASSFPASTSKAEAPKTPLVDLPDFALDQVHAPAKPTISRDMLPPQMPVAPQVAAFDLGSLSLDLNNTNATATALNAVAVSNGPLETKLALAQEFRSIGDNAGAKMLATEVFSTATGTLKTKAEAMLAEIG